VFSYSPSFFLVFTRSMFFFFSLHFARPIYQIVIHSFPTRRSSDLTGGRLVAGRRSRATGGGRCRRPLSRRVQSPGRRTAPREDGWRRRPRGRQGWRATTGRRGVPAVSATAIPLLIDLL